MGNNLVLSQGHPQQKKRLLGPHIHHDLANRYVPLILEEGLHIYAPRPASIIKKSQLFLMGALPSGFLELVGHDHLQSPAIRPGEQVGQLIVDVRDSLRCSR